MRRIVAVTLVALVALVAHGTLVGSTDSAGASRTRPGTSGAVTVSAAASLGEAFAALARRFERQHPAASVHLNFASSATLAAQIRAGAPVDVFAAADAATMDALVASGHVTAPPARFARNEMQIVVKPGNPERVSSVGDLRDVRVVALCASTAPCGAYAAEVLRRARVALPDARVTRSPDARATVAAVAQGDADAAIVYATDALAAGSAVARVGIPSNQNAVAVYTIAPIAGSSNRRLARAFVAAVTAPEGQRILARYGFLPA